MTARKVLVARHGERLDFIDPDFRDAAALPDDPPLTARGELQARQLGARLRFLNVTAVYASPFQRCVRTAALAAASATTPDRAEALRVRVEPGLCERLSAVRYFQTAAGPLWRSVAQLLDIGAATVDGADRLDAAHEPVMPADFNTTGYPESGAAMASRCARVVSEIVARDETDGDILLVGHVSSVKAMIGALSPETRTFALSVPYACLSVFTPRDAEQRAYDAELLCANDFQSDEARTASVHEFSGGFPKTKYVLMMARGLVYSTLRSKP